MILQFYQRLNLSVFQENPENQKILRSAEDLVASEGFEPPKAEPADLQSDPFGRLGN